MGIPYDRPAAEPGGMECMECGVIFVGSEWHTCCAVCAEKPRPIPYDPEGNAGMDGVQEQFREDPHDVIHIYEGDSAFVVRDNGNKSLYGVQLPEMRALFNGYGVTQAMVDAFMEELRRQGVVFDDFSEPIYPARLYQAMRAALEDTRHAD